MSDNHDILVRAVTVRMLRLNGREEGTAQPISSRVELHRRLDEFLDEISERPDHHQFWNQLIGFDITVQRRTESDR